MNNGKKFKITNGNQNNKYIKLVANQKVIKLIKYSDSIDYTAHNKARKDLSANAFVLYDYLLCHSNNWVWALSSADVINETPLKIGTYNKAVAELIEMRYLVPHDIDIGSVVLDKDANHSYYFFETPTCNNSDTLPKHIISEDKDDFEPFAECEEHEEVSIRVELPQVLPWEMQQPAISHPARYY